MEPQLPTPISGPENRSQPQPQGGEVFSGQIPGSAEIQQTPIEQGRETRENLQDGPKGDPVSVSPVFAPPPLPVIDPAQGTVTVTKKSLQDDNPSTASDEDLIEKEWVEKAKKLVSETKNDPHAQENAVSLLQADYLQKRYGRTIKISSEG